MTSGRIVSRGKAGEKKTGIMQGRRGPVPEDTLYERLLCTANSHRPKFLGGGLKYIIGAKKGKSDMKKLKEKEKNSASTYIPDGEPTGREGLLLAFQDYTITGSGDRNPSSSTRRYFEKKNLERRRKYSEDQDASRTWKRTEIGQGQNKVVCFNSRRKSIHGERQGEKPAIGVLKGKVGCVKDHL